MNLFRPIAIFLTACIVLSSGGVLVAAEDDREHSHEHSQEHSEELDHDHDHDMARIAVERGEAAPLGEILKVVSENFSGEVADVSLIRSNQILTYRIRLILKDHRVFDILVNAITRAIISVSAH